MKLKVWGETMRKYLQFTLAAICAVAMAAIFPSICVAQYPEVTATYLKEVSYQESVRASGMIQEVEKKELSLDVPVVPKEVYVSVGDEVSAGDVIATVDQEQTVQALSNLQKSLLEAGGTSEVSALLAGSSMDDPVNSLPDVIVANASGTITSLGLNQGEMVSSGQPVLSISDLSQMQVMAYVNENSISQIKLGQRAVISGKPLGEKSYTAVVKQIYPTAETKVNGLSSETVVNVVLELEQPDDSLRAGTNVTTKITTKEQSDIKVIPYSCVDQDDDGTEFVYCLKDGRAVKTPITTGIELDEGTAVLSGISETDIVLSPASAIRKDGMLVRVKR